MKKYALISLVVALVLMMVYVEARMRGLFFNPGAKIADAQSCINMMPTYQNCTTIQIEREGLEANCSGVPGCNIINGNRTELKLPAPWVVVGGNWNTSQYTDSIHVCQMIW